MAGLPVVSDEMAREKFGGMLYLNVAALHSKLGESDSYAITLELSQPASLLRDPTILVPLAVTWDARTIGRGSVARVRERVKDHVDQFINVWLSANPKKP
jgi:hypothetical protein